MTVSARLQCHPPPPPAKERVLTYHKFHPVPDSRNVPPPPPPLKREYPPITRLVQCLAVTATGQNVTALSSFVLVFTATHGLHPASTLHLVGHASLTVCLTYCYSFFITSCPLTLKTEHMVLLEKMCSFILLIKPLNHGRGWLDSIVPQMFLRDKLLSTTRDVNFTSKVMIFKYIFIIYI